MIGSPSAVIGIGPLIICRMPTSFSTGMRAPRRFGQRREAIEVRLQQFGPKSCAMPFAPHGGVFDSQPPTASAPGSGFT